MTPTTRRPLPGRIWGMLAAMVLLALVCLLLALVLGSRLRALGPERGGGREGYMQVTKPMPGATDAESMPVSEGNGAANTEGEAQLAALMDGQGAFVTGTASGTAPLGASDAERAMKISETLAEVSATLARTVEDKVPLETPLVDMLPTEVPPAGAVPALAPLPAERAAPLAVPEMPQAPRWQQNAVKVNVAPGAPMLALLIDDMGGQMEASTRAVEELPAGVTLSFFPWSKPGVELARRARQQGHEIMIHMPMEALAHGAVTPDPGPDSLRVGMTPQEIATRLTRNVRNLSDLAVGLNNHMGSRFTEWAPGVRAVLTVLQGEGMLFLDSKTAAPTAVKEASRGLVLPVLTRDIFLDHVPTPEAVRAELNKAVLLARKRGSAIAIGHPLPVTLDVLQEMLPQIVSSGVVLVPVTKLVK